jgi:hypothetical protein
LHLDAIDGHDSPPQSRTFVHFTPHEWLNQGLLSKRHNQVEFSITAEAVLAAEAISYLKECLNSTENI